MSKAKHTPGPWTVHRGQDYVEVLLENKLADRVIMTLRYPGDDDIANAYLMAGAPDMRAALIAIIERSSGRLYDTDQETGETFVNLALNAIAKTKAP